MRDLASFIVDNTLAHQQAVLGGAKRSLSAVDPVRDSPELGRLERYAHVLQAAVDASPPPFGQAWYGDEFRALVSDVDWFAYWLLVNSCIEADGSRGLWLLASQTGRRDFWDDPTGSGFERMAGHAVDEARHSALYVKIVDKVFPGALPREEVDALLPEVIPRYRHGQLPELGCQRSDESVIDAAVQTNLAEIRTCITQHLAIPVIRAYCPESDQAAVDRITSSILDDEYTHIHYTAALLERACRSGYEDHVFDLMREQLGVLNELTLKDLITTDIV